MAANVPSTKEIQREQSNIGENTRPSIISANVIGIVIVCVAIGFRLVSRRLKHLAFKTDDALACLGAILTIGFGVTSLFSVSVGAGKHLILTKNPTPFVKAVLAESLLYLLGIVLIKLSLIFLYRRIFPTRGPRIVLWIIGIIVVISGVWGMLMEFLTCRPFRGYWDLTIKRYCIDQNTYISSNGIFNIFIDFSLLCLPMPLVWRLKMSRSRKIQVSGAFALGGVASIIGIVRVAYVFRRSTADGTWTQGLEMMWSMAEVSVGVASACAPTFGPMVTLVLNGWRRHAVTIGSGTTYLAGQASDQRNKTNIDSRLSKPTHRAEKEAYDSSKTNISENSLEEAWPSPPSPVLMRKESSVTLE